MVGDLAVRFLLLFSMKQFNCVQNQVLLVVEIRYLGFVPTKVNR